MSSMLFADIDLVNEKGIHTPHAYVGVTGDRIDYVGTTKPEAAYDSVYNGNGKVLMPALYNAHSHLPMVLMRGCGENLPLDRWLNEAIFPVEEHLTEDYSYAAMLLGIAESLRFGVVSFTDMYYNSDARARAALESGVKLNVGHSILNSDETAHFHDLPEYSVDKQLIRHYNEAGNGRIKVDFNLHAEYTSTRPVAEEVAQAAKEAGLRIQVHASETKDEVRGCKERHDGMTPIAYLADCGILDVPATVAHCVWLEQDDYRILAEKGAFVATCPASNAKLGSGIADVLGMRKAGITVALGTDGVASNNNHNMFKDMYLLAMMQRAQLCTPVALSAAEIIEIATRNGALSQGRDDCGLIAPGAKADLIVLATDTPWFQPVDSLVSNLVYSAQGSDVVLTMVDGSVLYRDGEFLSIDVEKAIADTCAASKAMMAQI